MTNELTFITDSLFENVTFDRGADYWRFSFADNIYASASGFWRLLSKRKILLVSLDEGQKFGLPEPTDLVNELTKMLQGKTLTRIEVFEDTNDLILTLTDEILIQIYIASSGYETYDFFINSKQYIGLGGGDIAIIDNH